MATKKPVMKGFKAFEKSGADKKKDKKMGVKESSKKEIMSDKKAFPAFLKGKKGK